MPSHLTPVHHSSLLTLTTKGATRAVQTILSQTLVEASLGQQSCILGQNAKTHKLSSTPEVATLRHAKAAEWSEMTTDWGRWRERSLVQTGVASNEPTYVAPAAVNG